jgi:hypothetical protein
MKIRRENAIETHIETITSKGGISLFIPALEAQAMEVLAAQYGMVTSTEPSPHPDEVLINISTSEDRLKEYLADIPF